MDKISMDMLLTNSPISRKMLFFHNVNRMMVRNLSKLRGKEGPKRKYIHMMRVRMSTVKLHTMGENDARGFWIISIIYLNIINYLSF